MIACYHYTFYFRSKLTYVAIFVDGVSWGIVVVVVHAQVNDLGVSGWTKGLGDDKCRIIDRAGSPLMESRLVGWRGSERLPNNISQEAETKLEKPTL
jgi:hypothetical protein